jgi:hypothetical protein
MPDNQTNTPAPKFDKARAERDISWLGARLREPSTYAGLATLLGVVGMTLDPGLLKYVSMIGMGIGGIISFALPEQIAS